MSNITIDTFVCKICGCRRSKPIVMEMRDWEYAAPGTYGFYKCLQCGIIQLWPFPSLDGLQEAYPEEYQQFHDTTPHGPLMRLFRSLLDAVTDRNLEGSIPKDAIVLDVGCGNGEYLEKVRRLGASELWGVDFSPHATRATRVRGFSVFEGLFRDFQCDDLSFDLIMMNNYLEHTMTPVDDLGKAFRLLKPHGSLLGSVPNFNSLDRKLFGRYWGMSHVPRHLFQYTTETLTELLERSGFERIAIRSSLTPTAYSLSIQNFLRRKTVEAGTAKPIPGGRMPYYPALIVLTAPLALISLLFSHAGLVHFTAYKR